MKAFGTTVAVLGCIAIVCLLVSLVPAGSAELTFTSVTVAFGGTWALVAGWIFASEAEMKGWLVALATVAALGFWMVAYVDTEIPPQAVSNLLGLVTIVVGMVASVALVLFAVLSALPAVRRPSYARQQPVCPR